MLNTGEKLSNSLENELGQNHREKCNSVVREVNKYTGTKKIPSPVRESQVLARPSPLRVTEVVRWQFKRPSQHHIQGGPTGTRSHIFT